MLNVAYIDIDYEVSLLICYSEENKTSLICGTSIKVISVTY